MSLLDSLIGAVTGKTSNPLDGADTSSIQSALGGLLEQNGGLKGLMGKFSQGGLGDVFSSWVGMGENKSISPDQIQNVLGSEQVMGLASKLGVDPSKASGFLSEYLPKIIDKLSPSGQVEEGADHATGLSALLPSLLASFGGGSK
ncbi:MAG: hypothetical protein JWL81_1466 [Verrucomicrobiales bacterium]|nr:hypothetical protein [Verrucomicrobiales bacterium]